MTGRPEILWPLFGALERLDGIGPKSAIALTAAHIEKPRDLLFTLPHSAALKRKFAKVVVFYSRCFFSFHPIKIHSLLTMIGFINWVIDVALT